MTEEQIYCQWVNETVPINKVPEECAIFFRDGRCVRCEKSPQLDLGMKPMDLLRNIREK
jgi:hypothetical protein